MELKEKLSVQEMKELSNQIILEESLQNQFSINAIPMTVKEYYQKEIFEGGMKLIKEQKYRLKNSISLLKENQRENGDIKIISGTLRQYSSKIVKQGFVLMRNGGYKLALPFVAGGYFSSQTKQVRIFIRNNRYKVLFEDHILPKLIKTTYHEIRHQYQDERIIKNNTYEAFLMQIEMIVMAISYNNIPIGNMHYRANHDNYMIEIDANNYGINKTIEYLQKYPEIYEKNREYLEKRKKKYEQDLQTYDAYSMFEKMNLIINEEPKIFLEKMSILKYFYRDDGKFKSLSEIITNQDKIDKKIIDLILSSKSFVEQLNFNLLTDYEKTYMVNLLENAYQREWNRQLKVQELEMERATNKKNNLYQLRQILKNINKFKGDFLWKSNDEVNRKTQNQLIENILSEEEQTRGSKRK